MNELIIGNGVWIMRERPVWGPGALRGASAMMIGTSGRCSAVNTGLTVDRVQALAIDPAAPSTLYAGTSGGGVFKSTDGCGAQAAKWNKQPD